MHGTITVELDDNGVIISDDVTLCYGDGPDFVSALVDFAQTVLEWYQMTDSDTRIGKEFDDAYETAIKMMDGEDIWPERYTVGPADQYEIGRIDETATILERGNIMRRKGRYAER